MPGPGAAVACRAAAAAARRGRRERPAVRQLPLGCRARCVHANDVVVLTKGGERIAEVTASLTPDVVERFAVPAELAA
jgi:hypothetical protein